MSIFNNMMGFGQMMSDSFSGGMGDVEQALLESNQIPEEMGMGGPMMQAMMGADQGGPPMRAPQPQEQDEMTVGTAATGEIPQSGGGGGMIGRTLSGDSIAGNIAGLVGDMYTGGMVSQMQDAYKAAQGMKDGQNPMSAGGFQSLMGLFT